MLFWHQISWNEFDIRTNHMTVCLQPPLFLFLSCCVLCDVYIMDIVYVLCMLCCAEGEILKKNCLRIGNQRLSDAISSC